VVHRWCPRRSVPRPVPPCRPGVGEMTCGQRTAGVYVDARRLYPLSTSVGTARRVGRGICVGQEAGGGTDFTRDRHGAPTGIAGESARRGPVYTVESDFGCRSVAKIYRAGGCPCRSQGQYRSWCGSRGRLGDTILDKAATDARFMRAAGDGGDHDGRRFRGPGARSQNTRQETSLVFGTGPLILPPALPGARAVRAWLVSSGVWPGCRRRQPTLSLVTISHRHPRREGRYRTVQQPTPWPSTKHLAPDVGVRHRDEGVPSVGARWISEAPE